MSWQVDIIDVRTLQSRRKKTSQLSIGSYSFLSTPHETLWPSKRNALCRGLRTAAQE